MKAIDRGDHPGILLASPSSSRSRCWPGSSSKADRGGDERPRARARRHLSRDHGPGARRGDRGRFHAGVADGRPRAAEPTPLIEA
jgi:hypothetical protein